MTERAKNTSPSAEKRTTSRTPEGFVPKDQPGDTTEADRLEADRLEAAKAQTDASTMEAAPADQMGPTGGSFYNAAHVGSGTILPDGTYGAPLPDPNVERLAKLAEETKDSDTSK